MNATTFWILFLVPTVVLVLLRIARQRSEDRTAYLGRVVFRSGLSVLTYALYAAIVWKFWYLSSSNDFDSPERLIRGNLSWLLFYWSIGTFDRETWKVW